MAVTELLQQAERVRVQAEGCQDQRWVVQSQADTVRERVLRLSNQVHIFTRVRFDRLQLARSRTRVRVRIVR